MFSSLFLDRFHSLFAGVWQSLAITGILLAALYLFEALLIGLPRCSLRLLLTGRTSAVIDLLSSLLVLSNLALVVGSALSFGAIYWASSIIKNFFSLSLLPHQSYPMLSYLVFILVLDFMNYWVHRLMHRNVHLWHIHKFHHSASSMTMLTALRDHPLERVTVHGFNALPTALLGVPPEQYFLVQLLLQSLGFVKHSNFSSDWGWFGRWFIQSPRAHRIHHSIQTDHFDTNFATIFQFWDVIFGTSMHVPVSTRIDIGLPDEEVSRGPIRAIFRTTSEFYASLVRSF